MAMLFLTLFLGLCEGGRRIEVPPEPPKLTKRMEGPKGFFRIKYHYKSKCKR